jgi:hypothetical protein
MADSTRRVSVRLSLDNAEQVKSGLREVGETGQREMERITRGAEGASRALRLLGPVLAGISIGGLAAMARSAVDAVGGLGELADAAGVSTDALQAFQYAATQVGLSNEELQRSLAALTRRISDAAIGEQQAQQAFRRLGIEFRDASGNARATEAVIADLAERIAELSDPAERAAAATALFGDRLGQRMIPFLAQGREGLERLIGEALRFGAIADADLIAKADEASDKIAALERAFSSLARNLLAQVAPALSTVANAINRVMTGASLAERRASLEESRARLQQRLRELEAEEAGETALSAQPRRGAVQRGLQGVAREQAGVRRPGLIEELRQQLEEINREIGALDAEARAAEERVRRILDPERRAGGGEAEARRRRAAEDIARLQESLDARLRIEREFQARLTRIREAEQAGAIDAAEAQRLIASATRERDEALQRLNTTQRSVTASTREAREAERELNDVLRERERLIQQNETAYERYQRRLTNLGALVERAERMGVPVPEETIRREAVAALEELERAERRVEEAGTRARDVGRELGLTFSSAFEDAIVRGRRFSEVLQGIVQDLARIIARRTITEPLGNALSSALSGFSFGGVFGSIGSWLGGLFRADGGPVTAGRPYIVGERGPEWFVPRQSGVVLPNGVAPGGPTINTSIAIDARGADAGVEARLRLLAGQIARQASVMTLDAIRRGGAAYETVRG